jgi:hypothetical protein
MPTEAEIQAQRDAEAAAAAAKKTTFTEDQQSVINDMFDKRFGKIQSKHEQELARVKAEAEEKVAAAEAAAAAAAGKKGGAATGEDDPQVKQFKDLLENEKKETKKASDLAARHQAEATKAREEAMAIRKENAITQAASGCNFHDLKAVLKLTADMVEWSDEDKAFVIRENGVIKQNNELKNASLEEFYRGYAATNDYLVNGSVVGGAGSQENRGGGVSTLGVIKSKADLKDAKQKSEYITKNGLEKFEALPLK